jgi:hypothetical protein
LSDLENIAILLDVSIFEVKKTSSHIEKYSFCTKIFNVHFSVFKLLLNHNNFIKSLVQSNSIACHICHDTNCGQFDIVQQLTKVDPS